MVIENHNTYVFQFILSAQYLTPILTQRQPDMLLSAFPCILAVSCSTQGLYCIHHLPNQGYMKMKIKSVMLYPWERAISIFQSTCPCMCLLFINALHLSSREALERYVSTGLLRASAERSGRYESVRAKLPITNTLAPRYHGLHHKHTPIEQTAAMSTRKALPGMSR